MASQHRFITTSGTTIWFAGIPVTYNGTGTPWTSQATSPFQIAMNTVTGPIWTPQAPQPNTVFGGGGPFRHGSSPVYNSYGNVTEDLPIQIRATSHDNAVAALRALRAELLTALAQGPLIFVFQPDGATNAVYYEVSAASVQENAISLNQEARSHTFRSVITLTRQPLGGTTALSAMVNSVTCVNNSTSGSNQNLRSLGTINGDLTNEGQPLHVRIGETSVSGTLTRILLSTVASRTATSGSGAKSTTSTTGTLGTASYSFTAAAAQTNFALKPRFLLRVSAIATNSEIRIRVITGSTGTGFTTLYTSPWKGYTSAGAKLIDFGTWSLHYLRVLGITATDFTVLVDHRSTNGASATFTDDYGELLLYYDFLQVDVPGTSSNSLTYWIEGMRKSPNGPYLPRYPIAAYATLSTSAPWFICAPPRGQLRAFSGCSIWVAWYFAAQDAHAKADTISLKVEYAPLYKTVRGAG